ncbi:MAG TPA: ABC transporter ATP-binding protein, partial [Chloroflexota bacterium]|nr:ABC transporter ATP-binding protein [Chloroflexota bacterium]
MVPTIQLADVSKRFSLAGRRAASVREVIQSFTRRDEGKIFWALRDVSFEVASGETIGLIGSNGSGKSTVLKLISGIMRPTGGKVRVEGSVSALIELGAGFHPEFSGRDNIFVYGALLGLSRADVRRKFEAIVEFAELDRFIDSPVKHYSSGMYMRLAFAIAAHVEPEILLVDEVLAVGDEAFQRKCLARIQSLQSSGVTVVYVSHAMETVSTLCDRAVWIDHGVLQQIGPARSTIAAYRQAVSEPAAPRRNDGTVHSLEIRNVRNEPINELFSGQPLRVRVVIRLHEPAVDPAVGLRIATGEGLVVYETDSRRTGLGLGTVGKEEERLIEFAIPAVSLSGGPDGHARSYRAITSLVAPFVADEVAADFAVLGGPATGLIDLQATARTIE